MKKGAKIGKLNRIKGNINVELDEYAFFGKPPIQRKVG